MNISQTNKTKNRKLFQATAIAFCLLLVAFVLLYLWEIFPVSDDEQNLAIHEEKMEELLNLFGKCEVFFAGNSVQIEYDGFASKKITDEKLMSELCLNNPEYNEIELAAYYAVYSAFMYLSERSVGEGVDEITCRFTPSDGTDATLVRRTKDEFHAAYTKSRSKVSRDRALVECVYNGIHP